MAEELLGEFRVGFFAEAFDFVGRVCEVETGEGGFFTSLDIAVGGAGPGGLDADGEEGVGAGGGGEGISEDGLESGLVLNELIGGEDGHGGLGVTGGDEADAEGDGGGGVTFGRLGEDVLGGELGGDFADFFFLEGVGEDEDVFERDEAIEAVDGLL